MLRLLILTFSTLALVSHASAATRVLVCTDLGQRSFEATVDHEITGETIIEIDGYERADATLMDDSTGPLPLVQMTFDHASEPVTCNDSAFLVDSI